MSVRGLKRPLLGFAVGAFTGAALVSARFTVEYATSYPVEGGTFAPTGGDIVRWAVAIFIGALIVWSIGLTVVGVPIWRLLHDRGVRGPFAAVLLGAITVYVVGMLWPPTSATAAVEPARLLLAIAGGVVGLVIERVAYVGPPKPPPARPS